mgnify:CR=1 FL=1
MDLIYIVFGIMISILFILLGITFHSISKEKNIELIKDSKIFISSEGFWTHIAQALRKRTIGYSDSKYVIHEFNTSKYVKSASTVEELIECTEQVI